MQATKKLKEKIININNKNENLVLFYDKNVPYFYKVATTFTISLKILDA